MTLTIDRMEIDDAGANPKKLADTITRQLPDTLNRVPVREIAKAIDIYEIREKALSGLEGALIVPADKSEGAILLHSKSSPQRKRYTIAHEIGHYVNPMHIANSENGFECTRKDMKIENAKPGDKHAKMELEANQFAAELLMPHSWVSAYLRSKLGVDIEHILGMASRFDVSKEAAARRYLACSEEPIAIVFSHAGKIRYIKKSDSFPRLSVWSGDSVPADCISATSSAEIGEVTDVVESPGHLWLEKSRGYSLGEQTLAQQNEYRMTVLTVEDQDDEDVWESPKFKR